MTGYTRTIPLKLTGSVQLPITRSTAGSYINGKYVAGTTSVVTIKASVQPVMRSTNLSMLSEGDKALAALEIFSPDEIRMVKEGDAAQEADKFQWNDEWYEVMKVVRWQMGIIDHFHAIAKRVETV